MSLFKCKMCGGDLEIVEGASIAECEFCGTRQPVPKAVDENLQNLFNRANALRIKSEFDKAEKIYERIIQADSTQADAYWGLILCKYGIEYIDDPETYEKIPTCHRASYESIIADDDYKAALANADMSQRILYEKQAHEIDRIQKEILALAQQEESYDVFICYKETDPNGARTHDSVIANDIYHQLTGEGFKVFYAAITLEGKLGSAYEPIIFAALNSAKVMLSIGTKPEYFNAVWVKNEWSRYLKIINQDHSKVLIPCYKDMDAYELPEEFAHLQAQDMSKIGFINDLIRGIKKVLHKDEPQPVTVVKEVVTNVTADASANTAPLLKRAFMFLEDKDWTSANEYCEKVLDIDPENAEAYLGKLMAELRVRKKADLKNCENPFDGKSNYQKITRFGSASLIKEVKQYNDDIRARNEAKRKQEEENRKEGIYQKAVALSKQQTSEKQIEAMNEFKRIPGYRDANERAKRCDERAVKLAYDQVLTLMERATTSKQFEDTARAFSEIPGNYPPAKQKEKECRAKAKELAEIERKDNIYFSALGLFKQGKETEDISSIENAIQKFQSVIGWKDSSAQIDRCHAAIADIKEAQERKRIAHEKAVKKAKRIAAIVTSIVCVVTVFIILLNTVIIPNGKYNDAMALMEAGKMEQAYNAFHSLAGYKDSAEKMESIREYVRNQASLLAAEQKYQEAYDLLESVDYTESTFVDMGLYKAFLKEDYKTVIDKYGVTTIIIPNGVTKIDASKFEDCKNLKSIVIPDSVTSIGDSAFEGCTGLTSITIPNSVTSIGDSAFEGCTGLTSITIPNSVTSIGDSTFEGCTGLTSITIPNSVTSIGDSAFEGCTGLTSITIPNSVTSIGSDAFEGCTSLTSITLPFVGNTLDGTSNTHLGYIFGAYYYYHNSDYIPKSLKTVIITGGSKIGDYAFYQCISLTSITIPNSVTSIGDNAFSWCSKLTSITIPNSVTSIGEYAFSNCDNLTSITVNSNNQNYCSIDGVLFNKTATSLICCPAGKTGLYSIPDSVTSIGSSAFGDCDGLTSVAIPNSVTSIGSSAFSGCDGLTSITIPNSVTSIGEYAFKGCTRLTSITIPNSVTSIGEYAFKGCTRLTSITIPNSVTSIGEYAFKGCTRLTSITIPNSVTSIGGSAFSGCSSLTSITLPFIGKTLDGTNNTHFGYIFGAANSSDNSKYIPKSLKTVIITGGSKIGFSAFSGCTSLTSVTIPSSVTSIGDSAFSGCTGLTSITLPFVGNTLDGTSNTHLGYIFGTSSYEYNSDYVPKSLKTVIITGGSKIGDYAFYWCKSLTSIVIPDSVTSIGSSAFYNCDGLTSITIPNSVTSIGESAFDSCSSLTSITIPNSVTSIGDSAFSYCRSLTSITIPNSVTSIGEKAFYICDELTSITFNGTTAQWNAISKRYSWKSGVPAKKVVCSNGTVSI